MKLQYLRAKQYFLYLLFQNRIRKISKVHGDVIQCYSRMQICMTRLDELILIERRHQIIAKSQLWGIAIPHDIPQHIGFFTGELFFSCIDCEKCENLIQQRSSRGSETYRTLVKDAIVIILGLMSIISVFLGRGVVH